MRNPLCMTMPLKEQTSPIGDSALRNLEIVSLWSRHGKSRKRAGVQAIHPSVRTPLEKIADSATSVGVIGFDDESPAILLLALDLVSKTSGIRHKLPSTLVLRREIASRGA